MTKMPAPTTINQTTIGNENIQVIGSHNVITRITNFIAGGTEQERAYRDRRKMLELVKNTWIKGVLEKSLYNEVLIDLAMDTRPEKVEHPWDMQIEMPDQSSRTLPSGTSMIDVFDEMNGAMLILGEAGSGKTTMLLELARDCIERAMQDDNQPIPVVFNLSSWDGKQTTEDFLIKELRTKYNVPIKTAKSWVVNDYLLLILDGLDEVKPENREKCVEAIDQFRKKHGLTTPIAVCSRIAEYEALTGRLDLQGAVILQPLTAEQIEMYFEQVGPKLESLRQILNKDEVLQELARQPLMLSIMTLAYLDISTDTLASKDVETAETRRNHLFDIYIEKMFGRVARTKNELYVPEQAKAWLAWLARKMMEHNQVPFLVEEMQPKWLDQSKKRIFSGLFGLTSYLMAGLIFAVIFDLLLDHVNGSFPQIQRNTPSLGVIMSLLLWLNDRLRVPITWNWKKRLFMGLIVGLAARMAAGTSGVVIVIESVLISLSFGWLGSLSEIRTVDSLTWSWSKALVYGATVAAIIGLVSGFLESLIVGIIVTILGTILYLFIHDRNTPVTLMEVDQIVDSIAARIEKPIPAPLLESIKTSLFDLVNSLTPFSGLKIGVAVWLSQSLVNAILVLPFIAIILGVSAQKLGQTTYPGQRLVNSFRNSVRILLSMVLLSVGIVLIDKFVFVQELFFRLTDLRLVIVLGLLAAGSNLTLAFAIASGLIGWIRLGGIALLQHYVLRFIIACNNYLPWCLIPFLDYCVDRIFLRRVGGGYIFVHRSLMEHFAAMYSERERLV